MRLVETNGCHWKLLSNPGEDSPTALLFLRQKLDDELSITWTRPTEVDEKRRQLQSGRRNAV